MKPVRTLVVLASEAEARLLVSDGPGRGLTELSGLRAEDFPDTQQEFTDAPGRQSAAPGMGRHAYTSRETVEEARRATFAPLIIDAIAEAWRRGGYDRILLAASPKLLGELRKHMPADLSAALLADLPKDLVKVAARDLPAHFSDVARL